MAEFEVQGRSVFVDDADLARVLAAGPWFIRKARNTFYARRNVAGSSEYLHRFVLRAASSQCVDHISGEGLDNRRQNLRSATFSENSGNSRRHRDNSTGFKGVYQEKRTGRFVSSIMRKGKRTQLGTFGTAEEAHVAYCCAAEALFGEFANHG